MKDFRFKFELYKTYVRHLERKDFAAYQPPEEAAKRSVSPTHPPKKSLNHFTILNKIATSSSRVQKLR